MKGFKIIIVIANCLSWWHLANAQVIKGDMDGNGTLSIGDITVLAKTILGELPAEAIHYPITIPGQIENGDFLGLSKPVYVCHRALSGIDCPENSVHAVRNAAKLGQSFVECDVQQTADGISVVCHDATINSTMSSRLYGSLSSIEPIYINSLTWERLVNDYVYNTDIEEYKTRICTFEEWLEEVAKHQLTPLLHNVSPNLLPLVQRYFGNRFIWMGNFARCMQVRALAPDCFIIYQYAPEQQSDGTISDIPSVINAMKQIGGLCAYSSMVPATFSDEFLAALHQNGFYAQFSSSNSYNVPEMLEKGCNLILANNWCNENMHYAKVFDLKCSTFHSYQRTIKSGEKIAIPFSVQSRNVKVEIMFRGRANFSFNNQPYYFNTHEEVKIYEIGCNATTPEVLLHIQPVSDIQLLDIKFFEGAI